MITVTKATGEKEEFSEEKVRNSIRRTGIPDSIQDLVVNHVKEKLHDNIKTSEIYHHISEFLDKSSTPFARSKYRLKHAIMEFGPTGYPFEDFVAELLKTQGYKTDLRQILDGKCVKHEIDIIAEKDGKKSMIECKFHNSTGVHTQVHVSLYTKARFDDLKEKHSLNDVWLVTNTRMTTDALDYAKCNNLKVMSWNYPPNESLRDLIENSGLHPITALTTISRKQKQELVNNHYVLCRYIAKDPNALSILNLPDDKKKKILEEAQYVCKI